MSVLSALLAAVTTQSNNKVKILILTGQSNAVGAALNSNATTQELDEQSNVNIFQYDTVEFEKLNIGLHNNYSSSTTHGLELGLGQQLEEEIYLIKYGINSTEIDEHLPGGTVYNNLKNSFVDPAIVKLNELNIDYEIYFCYWQGEADANLEADSLAWAGKLDTLINTWQSNLGADIKFRLIQINAVASAYSANINNAIEAKAATSNLIDFIASKDLGSNLHFNYTNMKIISQLLINSL